MNYPYFDGPCVLVYDAAASVALGKEHWRRQRSYNFVLSDRQHVHVPAGGLTDKGSIPMVLNNVVPRDGKFEQAYDMHDQLCEYLSLTVGGKPYTITRERCDSLLYVAMQVLGATDREIGKVRAGVDSYRIASGVNLPTNTPVKRQLEANWEGSNDLCVHQSVH